MPSGAESKTRDSEVSCHCHKPKSLPIYTMVRLGGDSDTDSTANCTSDGSTEASDGPPGLLSRDDDSSCSSASFDVDIDMDDLLGPIR